MIHGVAVKNLRVIPDERGWLMEMLRCDDDVYKKFGQVYLSVGYPGVVKGWHYHKVQTDHFTIVKGMMKVVLYDGREGSPTRGEVNEFTMGELNPILVTIPGVGGPRVAIVIYAVSAKLLSAGVGGGRRRWGHVR